MGSSSQTNTNKAQVYIVVCKEFKSFAIITNSIATIMQKFQI